MVTVLQKLSKAEQLKNIISFETSCSTLNMGIKSTSSYQSCYRLCPAAKIRMNIAVKLLQNNKRHKVIFYDSLFQIFLNLALLYPFLSKLDGQMAKVELKTLSKSIVSQQSYGSTTFTLQPGSKMASMAISGSCNFRNCNSMSGLSSLTSALINQDRYNELKRRRSVVIV